MEIIYVKGIPPALFAHYVDFISAQERKNILYSLRWNSDLKDYFLSGEELSEYSWAGVLHTLSDFGYERVKDINDIGEFAVRGDTVQIWSPGMKNPVRMTFFGDELEKIEAFDSYTGRTIEVYKNFPIFSIKELSEKTDWENIESAGSAAVFAKKIYILLPLLSGEADADETYDLKQPNLYFKRFDLLSADIERAKKEMYATYIITSHKHEIPENLKQFIVSDLSATELPLANSDSLEMGLVSEKYKVVVLTDRELFGTIFVSSRRRKTLKSSEAQQLLSQLEGEIEFGDYIVHEDYGVGTYEGFVVEDGLDYLKIGYAEGDELFVPLEQINKLTKFIGDHGQIPVITRLGKNDWENIRKKVKASVAIIAEELARHYAKSKLATANPIETKDSEDYKNFLDQFEFEPTPDQLKAEREIIKDMDTKTPMNRVLIGDVGFGKTEVIMRASFKVVEAGAQVVVLCPTTVLALQHYQTFQKRFKDFPVNIALLSRHHSHTENKKTISAFAESKIDIIIGTHRILANDFQVKNLGLLVVDEEQRFGVKQKEKIRKLEYGVHALYVSATPIPRTLSMALSAIQDISLIKDPPLGRKPVTTHVEKFSWNEVVAAIRNEIERGGQVYFLHNEVKTIESVRAKLVSLMPGVRFTVGHGQMSPQKLEKEMADFLGKKYDCLVCTTIIESGLDIGNVNTIVVNNAQKLGLAQMYQLRGRVGRTDRQAYAYFFYKGHDLEVMKEISDAESQVIAEEESENARPKYIERLETILSSQELGSGFKVASRDLEIRGAGNLLGREQHGNISKIGYGLYMQMLAEEIERLKK